MDGHPARKRLRGKQPRPPAYSRAPGSAGDSVVEALDARGRQEQKGYGPCPPGITSAQWGALRLLHDRFCHPTADYLKRHLQRWQVPLRILEAVDKLDCSICKRFNDRPATAQQP